MQLLYIFGFHRHLTIYDRTMSSLQHVCANIATLFCSAGRRHLFPPVSESTDPPVVKRTRPLLLPRILLRWKEFESLDVKKALFFEKRNLLSIVTNE